MLIVKLSLLFALWLEETQTELVGANSYEKIKWIYTQKEALMELW